MRRGALNTGDACDVCPTRPGDGLARVQDGYVEIEKGFRARKPLTRVRITTKGRAAFAGYLDAMGKRGRDYVVREADRSVAVARYRELLADVAR